MWGLSKELMNNNKTFLLRDNVRIVGDGKWTADEFRSVNGHQLWIILVALKKECAEEEGNVLLFSK